MWISFRNDMHKIHSIPFRWIENEGSWNEQTKTTLKLNICIFFIFSYKFSFCCFMRLHPYFHIILNCDDPFFIFFFVSRVFSSSLYFFFFFMIFHNQTLKWKNYGHDLDMDMFMAMAYRYDYVNRVCVWLGFVCLKLHIFDMVQWKYFTVW